MNGQAKKEVRPGVWLYFPSGVWEYYWAWVNAKPGDLLQYVFSSRNYLYEQYGKDL